MSKPFTLIALTGLAGTGKDTVANLLVTHCGFTKLAFADALYNEVADAFGVEPLYLKHRDTKEHPMSSLALRKCIADSFVGRMIIHYGEQDQRLDLDAPRSPRQILQWWGTEYRRRQDPEYWTRQIIRRIKYQLAARLASQFVITDCRFQNEVDLVRNPHGYAGQLWRITRPGIDAPATGHASDTTGADFAPDRVINNSGDIHHLQALTIGAWLMHDAGMSAADLVRMGIAHVNHTTLETA